MQAVPEVVSPAPDEKLPSFPFYPKDFLSDENVELMTLEQTGAYIRLICSCWIHGSLPTDLDCLARMSRYFGDKFYERIWVGIEKCFRQTEINGAKRYIHPRLEKEKRNYFEYRALKSKAGKAGMEKRWGRKRSKKGRPYQEDNTAITRVKDSLLTKHNFSPSTSIAPSPSPAISSTEVKNTGGSETKPLKLRKIIPPKIEDVKAHFVSKGHTEDDAERFWHHHNSKGWQIGKHSMKDWHSASVTWFKNKEEFSRGKSQRNSGQSHGESTKPGKYDGISKVIE